MLNKGTLQATCLKEGTLHSLTQPQTLWELKLQLNVRLGVATQNRSLLFQWIHKGQKEEQDVAHLLHRGHPQIKKYTKCAIQYTHTHRFSGTSQSRRAITAFAGQLLTVALVEGGNRVIESDLGPMPLQDGSETSWGSSWSWANSAPLPLNPWNAPFGGSPEDLLPTCMFDGWKEESLMMQTASIGGG